MFCPHCGANNDNAARHCNQCGAGLVGPAQPVSSPVQQPFVPLPPPPPAYGVPVIAPGVPLPAGTVPNYMVQSILVTLCCCLPLGIVGIVKAGEVNNRLAVGDLEGALRASRTVKTCLWIGVALTLGGSIIYVILIAIGAVANSGGFR
ncbi:CD225/dispanin family protein [Terracidiphilus gabretensis]|jgi:hypothetical protein|uniref:CD225/dispanin family protein n=1 Tax=Terracidiphilus gabretensis TaxID=1577687 RepID=UPI0018D240D3|nr:CD225/dispanin family protein [Terracidiphilus gabretensis]